MGSRGVIQRRRRTDQVGEHHRHGPSDADAGEQAEEEQGAERRAEGGEQAKPAAERHSHDDGFPPAEDVGDDAPEEGPGQGAPEDAGAEERHLSDGESEGALAVLAHGWEDE